MRPASLLLLLALGIGQLHRAAAQRGDLGFPKTVEAGTAFSVRLSGNGQGTLYIVGPGQVLKRDVQLGQVIDFPASALYNAGHYLVVIARPSASSTDEFDVVPSIKPTELSFLARPSRLPVGIHDGITGAIYLFDGYHNLVTAHAQVQFELSNPSGRPQARAVTTRDGVAWTAMDSTAQQGADKFKAQVEGATSVRVIRQVPGDPCGLKMSASLSGKKLQLVTEPVRDCNGNAVSDGTIVTFTESYGDTESTVDVPLKRGIAEVEMPSHTGATISVASGVVLGNQIRWEK
jgi:hypothetical protein